MSLIPARSAFLATPFLNRMIVPPVRHQAKKLLSRNTDLLIRLEHEERELGDCNGDAVPITFCIAGSPLSPQRPQVPYPLQERYGVTRMTILSPAEVIEVVEIEPK